MLSVYTNCRYCILIIIGGFMVFNATFQHNFSCQKTFQVLIIKILGHWQDLKLENHTLHLRSLPEKYKVTCTSFKSLPNKNPKTNHYIDTSSWLVRSWSNTTISLMGTYQFWCKANFPVWFPKDLQPIILW